MNTDFRVSTGFQHNIKIKRLKRALGPSGPLCLIHLWGYVAQHCPTGSLGDLQDDEAEEVAGWQGVAGRLVTTLLDLHLLLRDPIRGLTIHQWEEHNGYAAAASDRSERAREAAKARWGAHSQEKAKDEPDATGNADSNATGNADSITGAYAPSPSPNPKHTKEGDTTSATPPRLPPEFLEFWRAYPKKVDKQQAWKAWKARIKAGDDPKEILVALQRYIATIRDPQFTRNPATFLSRDWAQWMDAQPPVSGGTGPVKKPRNPYIDTLIKIDRECAMGKAITDEIRAEYQRLNALNEQWVKDNKQLLGAPLPTQG